MLTMPFIRPVSPSKMRVPSWPLPRLTNTQCGWTSPRVPTLGTSSCGMVTAPVGLILSMGEAMPFWAWPGDDSRTAKPAAQKTTLADAIIVEVPYAPFDLFAKLWPGLATSQRETADAGSDIRLAKSKKAVRRSSETALLGQTA